MFTVPRIFVIVNKKNIKKGEKGEKKGTYQYRTVLNFRFSMMRQKGKPSFCYIFFSFLIGIPQKSSSDQKKTLKNRPTVGTGTDRRKIKNKNKKRTC